MFNVDMIVNKCYLQQQHLVVRLEFVECIYKLVVVAAWSFGE